ncbi:hypothetical protein GQ473_04665 [archaeon]|nr:hypothetical protein [archaeon]
MLLEGEWIEKVDVVNIPNWKSSNKSIGKQITKCLDTYAQNGKWLTMIKIIAGKASEITWLEQWKE